MHDSNVYLSSCDTSHMNGESRDDAHTWIHGRLFFASSAVWCIAFALEFNNLIVSGAKVDKAENLKSSRIRSPKFSNEVYFVERSRLLN